MFFAYDVIHGHRTIFPIASRLDPQTREPDLQLTLREIEVLTLSPAQLAEAKAQNLSILSYLANHFSNPTIEFAAPLIAFVAIAKSFLGHYIGASEGLKGLVLKTGRRPAAKSLDRMTAAFSIREIALSSGKLTSRAPICRGIT